MMKKKGVRDDKGTRDLKKSNECNKEWREYHEWMLKR